MTTCKDINTDDFLLQKFKNFGVFISSSILPKASPADQCNALLHAIDQASPLQIRMFVKGEVMPYKEKLDEYLQQFKEKYQLQCELDGEKKKGFSFLHLQHG